jgi:hypothetical protein
MLAEMVMNLFRRLPVLVATLSMLVTLNVLEAPARSSADAVSSVRDAAAVEGQGLLDGVTCVACAGGAITLLSSGGWAAISAFLATPTGGFIAGSCLEACVRWLT